MFTLVDTPGFDDDDLSDSDVLKMLVDWLASTYRNGHKLSGILYLHRITDARMRGSSVRNLNMFRQLIGDGFHKNLTLATSCWKLVPWSDALSRETELKTNSNFWKMMIMKGARLERLPDEVSKARDLVYEIASHEAIPVQTQRDVVDLGISFSNLAVTKTVNHELEQLKKQQAAERMSLAVQQEARLAQQRREYEEDLAACRELERAVEHHLTMQRYCSRNKPHGICDKPGCYNKVKRWTKIYREFFSFTSIACPWCSSSCCRLLFLSFSTR